MSSQKTNVYKGKRLTFQLLPIIFISFAVITIVSGAALFAQAIGVLRIEKQRMAEVMDESFVSQIMTEDNLPELFEYWLANEGKMSVIYDNSVYLNKVAKEYLYDRRDMSWELDEKYGTFNNWPEEDKKYYAEYKLMDFTRYFNELKQEFGPSYLFLMTRTGEEEFTFLVAGKNGKERRSVATGNCVNKDYIYSLGAKQIYDSTTYRDMYESYETGKPGWSTIKGDALSKEIRFMFYYPIVRDSKTIGVVVIENSFSRLIKEFAKTMGIIALELFIASMVMAYLLIMSIRKLIIKPISIIESSMMEFGENQNAQELTDNLKVITDQNEIGNLAQGMAEMGTELVYHIEEIKKMASKEERLNAEIEVAAGIQSAALPKNFEEFNKEFGVDLYAISRPAKIVGGDLYSFYNIDDDHIAIIVGDVSGKGIPAALFMMASKFYLENASNYLSDPSAILEDANNKICEKNAMNMFITVFVGILELSTGILRTANAGHEITMIKRANGQIEKLGEKHGIVLAAMEDMKYVTFETTLNKGDILIQYTDGVTEATNGNTQMYGMDRLVEQLQNSNCNSAKEQIDALVENVESFVADAEQFDDLTVLMLRIPS